uniref:Putative ovule protein n=1 Tax=Solanum chacoense TaxID=4108 RepID=A0A0V0HNK7_SOLCH
MITYRQLHMVKIKQQLVKVKCLNQTVSITFKGAANLDNDELTTEELPPPHEALERTEHDKQEVPRNFSLKCISSSKL